MENRLVIYTDGGSRGNPGPAAIGVLINKGDSYYEAIGETTNNVAEYKAIIFALRKVKSLIGGEKALETEVEVRSDSELVANQLNGTYKIKDEDLKPLFIEVWNLKQDFKKINFKHIPREQNTRANFLVNKELNSQNSLF